MEHRLAVVRLKGHAYIRTSEIIVTHAHPVTADARNAGPNSLAFDFGVADNPIIAFVPAMVPTLGSVVPFRVPSFDRHAAVFCSGSAMSAPA